MANGGARGTRARCARGVPLLAQLILFSFSPRERSGIIVGRSPPEGDAAAVDAPRPWCEVRQRYRSFVPDRPVSRHVPSTIRRPANS